MKRFIHTAAASVVAALAVLTVGLTAASASTASVVANHTAVTHLTNRPDSGAHGNNWALDTLTRTASIHLVGATALSHCGGKTGTGFCYKFTGTVADTGTFTTIAGQLAPGSGYENGGGNITMQEAITGKAVGGASYIFYSSWKTADRKPPANEDGDPSGRLTTGLWPTLFFQTVGPQLFDASGNPLSSSSFYPLVSGGWTYTAALGTDKACSNVTSQWVDASPDWGSSAGDGNILAPDAANC